MSKTSMNIHKINDLKFYNKTFENRVISEFFAHEEYLIYVFNKAERIVSAVYLVSNLISDLEPSKNLVRQKSLDLMSFISKVSRSNNFLRQENLQSIFGLLIEIRSYLSILTRSQIISEMNYMILNDEIINLISIVESLESNATPIDTVALSANFFTVDKGGVESEDQSPISKVVYSKKDDSHLDSEFGQDFTIKDSIKDINFQNSGSANDKNDKKELRKKLIIKLISHKGVVTVSQVSQVVKDCSEKTIQREMQHLVDINVLNKSGERRWTRYFLPKNK